MKHRDKVETASNPGFLQLVYKGVSTWSQGGDKYMVQPGSMVVTPLRQPGNFCMG